MPRSSKISPGWTIPAAVALSALLAGCSDYYYDRRDPISFHGGDAPAANKVAQTPDPWPAVAADRRIEGNGERMQRAVERYRAGKVTPLNTTSTSSVQNAPAPAAAPATAPAAPAAASP
jgi:hypothetical protein